jgi:hypothetical protein
VIQALSTLGGSDVALPEARRPVEVWARRRRLLDALLSTDQLIRPVDLKLRNREIKTEAEVEALVSEIRARLLVQIRAGARVRLV